MINKLLYLKPEPWNENSTENRNLGLVEHHLLGLTKKKKKNTHLDYIKRLLIQTVINIYDTEINV